MGRCWATLWSGGDDDRHDFDYAVAGPARNSCWYSAAGGDGLPLAQYVVAALDADPDQLADAVTAARDAHDVEIEVLALDALAQLLADQGDDAGARTALDAADVAMSGARHLLADTDRVDRARLLDNHRELTVPAGRSVPR